MQRLVRNQFLAHHPPMARPTEQLDYIIEEWARDDSRPLEVIARAGTLSVAYAAYWAAVAARPKGRIVLRQKAHELAARDPATG